MAPIAVYEPRHSSARLRFELYSDSIRAAGSRAGMEFDTTLPLGRLDPHFERLWLHNLWFFAGFYVVMLAAVLLMAIVVIAEMQDRPGPLTRPYALIGILGAVGLLLAIANSRKIEHIRFRNDAGIPALDIPRNRGGSEEFGQFVNLVIERICKVQGEARPAEFVPEDR
jgi:hypothetical protein